jgi:hypothetical protein
MSHGRGALGIDVDQILSDGCDEKGKLRTRARYFDIVPKMQHYPRYRLQHHGARGGQDVGPHI